MKEERYSHPPRKVDCEGQRGYPVEPRNTHDLIWISGASMLTGN